MESLNFLEMNKCDISLLILIGAACLLLGIIFFIGAIKAFCKCESNAVITASYITAVVLFLIGGFCTTSADELSSKYEYKVKIDANTDINYIYDNYEVIDTSSEIWVIRDKNCNCNCKCNCR